MFVRKMSEEKLKVSYTHQKIEIKKISYSHSKQKSLQNFT